MITLAVDIGGTKISAALISDDGSFLLKKQISTPHERCPDEMTGALRLLVSEMKGTAERFAVASTGIINNGVLTALNPDNLGGLKEYPLKNIMEDGNDSNLLIVFYVQIMPDDFVMQLHRF
ncbi:ROK family protein [Escherichia coli]|uniref:ROK family protein n=1 Tax=Escherichia coli TaxID=562 RepID=UPI00207B4532|nr:ROK family protein [Escherichia coli]